jgi:hypothetical protein
MTTIGAGTPTWAYTGKWPMREDTLTDGSTTTEWAQPTCIKPRPNKPNKVTAREMDDLNEKRMAKYL